MAVAKEQEALIAAEAFGCPHLFSARHHFLRGAPNSVSAITAHVNAEFKLYPPVTDEDISRILTEEQARRSSAS